MLRPSRRPAIAVIVTTPSSGPPARIVTNGPREFVSDDGTGVTAGNGTASGALRVHTGGSAAPRPAPPGLAGLSDCANVGELTDHDAPVIRRRVRAEMTRRARDVRHVRQ
jgi:hypothetical protein